MALVNFSSELQAFTSDASTHVKARDYRTMIAELCERYVDLPSDQLLDMAVAIDGVIITDPLLEPLDDSSEVHFLHFVAGG